MQWMEATGSSFVETGEAVSQAGEERKTHSAMAVSKAGCMTQLKRCEECKVLQPPENFKIAGIGEKGKPLRERRCMPCKRHARVVATNKAKMRGVDIDAIHYKLGAVKK